MSDLSARLRATADDWDVGYPADEPEGALPLVLREAADTIEKLTIHAGGPDALGSENERERSSLEPAPSNQEIATDAILVYWLNGTRDPDLAEWWQTPEAAECATEMADAILAALR